MSDSVLGDELLSGCGVWVVRLTAACEALEAALARLSAEPTTAERRDTRIEQSVPVPGGRVCAEAWSLRDTQATYHP